MGSKQKGIVLQSIKEILESLVVCNTRSDHQSDNLVTMEKIGTSNYFWAFPSSAGIARKNKLSQLKEEHASLEKELAGSIQKAKSARPETEEREAGLERLAYLKKRRTDLNAELDSLKDRDPATLEAKKKETKVAREAANRWTDNIFILQSYCASRFQIPNQQFCQQFGIPEDLDTV